MIWILMKNEEGYSLYTCIIADFILRNPIIKNGLQFDVRYDEQMEDFLDQAYERFVAKRDGSTKQRKHAKKAYSELLEV